MARGRMAQDAEFHSPGPACNNTPGNSEHNEKRAMFGEAQNCRQWARSAAKWSPQKRSIVWQTDGQHRG